MSRRDGIGEVDGWCHECGRLLPEPYTGETDLCEVCASHGRDPNPETVAKARRYWSIAMLVEGIDYHDEDMGDACHLCGNVHETVADDDWCADEESRIACEDHE